MRCFSRLRTRYRERGWTAAELGEHLGGLTPQSMTNRFSGRTPWNIDEMYKLMDLLDIPYSEMYLYFSKGGKWVEPVKPQRMRIKFTREAI